MSVEVMVSYRVIVRGNDKHEAEKIAFDHIPKQAFDQRVEALHCPPISTPGRYKEIPA